MRRVRSLKSEFPPLTVANEDAANCVCAAPLASRGENPISSFSAARSGCPALREVFLPDSIWQNYRHWHSRPDDVAGHRSVLILAHERGCLNRLTLPVHRYLLSAGSVRPDVRKQYVRDLREKWVLYEEPVERHGKWRMFQGRLAELQCAAFLEGRSYKIVGLEALREGPDIEAVSGSGLRSAFEVKFIGTEDTDFQLLLRSIAGQQSWGTVSPYAAINYLVFRAYEGARQLQAARASRTVVLIVDDRTWWRFELQLGGQWIDWRRPEFVGQETGWERFISRQRKRHRGLPADLATTLRSIDSVWILRQSSQFELHLEYDIPLSGNGP